MRTLHCTLLAATLALGGCALYPVEPKYDEAALIQMGKRYAAPGLNTHDAARLVTGWRIELEDAASTRQKSAIAASEVLYYGTLLAFIGAGGSFGDATKVRNIGAGLAGASTLFDARYRQESQRAVFQKATERMVCAERAAQPMSVAPVRDIFPDEDLTAVQPAIDAMPGHTLRFLDTQRRDLKAALQQVGLQPLTPDQWKALLAKMDEANTQAGNLTKNNMAAVSLLSNVDKNTPERGTLAAAQRRLASQHEEALKAHAALPELKRVLTPKPELTVLPFQSEAEFQEFKARYLAAIVKYPTTLDFCLSTLPQ